MSAHITMFNPAQRRVGAVGAPPAPTASQPKVVSVMGGGAGTVVSGGGATTILAFGSSPPPSSGGPHHHHLLHHQQGPPGSPSPLPPLNTTTTVEGTAGSLILFDPASYPSPGGGTASAGGAPNGQIYIEVRQAPHG
jgi:hypothetical protein